MTSSSDRDTTPDAPPPAPSRRRLPALDVLRGIAILGTLLTNIWIFSGSSSMILDDFSGDSEDGGVGGFSGALAAATGAAADGPANWVTLSSGIIQNVLNLVTDGKFIGLLTIMFGIGLEIQRQSAIRRGEKWPGRYPWRAGLLILDGLLNYIFIFEFDVLMGYGLTGLVVAAVLATSPKAQKIWLAIGLTVHIGLIAFFDFGNSLIYGAVDEGLDDVRDPALDSAERIRSATESAVVGTADGYWAQVASRLENFVTGRGEIPIMFTMGLGLFLVGAHLYRAGLFEAHGAKLRRWTMGLSFGIGLPIDWALRLSDVQAGGITRYVTSAMVAFGVLALVAEFYVRRTRRADAGEIPADRVTGPVGNALSLVGRMALTCYISQNLIASIIFYQWGFGVADKIQGQWYTYWTLLIYLGIAALLVGFSALWLRRFSRGPVELVWHWSYEAICSALDRRKERKARKEKAERTTAPVGAAD